MYSHNSVIKCKLGTKIASSIHVLCLFFLLEGYNDSPPMPRSPRTSERYQRHLSPPHDPRNRMSRMDEDYYYDYDDGYDDDEDDDEMLGDKPVPIWLGVMLVVAYIFGGAMLFNAWEEWGFLDSVYFCFITLTTIGQSGGGGAGGVWWWKAGMLMEVVVGNGIVVMVN